MTTDVFRYTVRGPIPVEEVEATLLLSVFAVEALHGESQTRLDAGRAVDRPTRAVVIDASTPVGRDLNRVFLGFLTREFGPDSFTVERVPRAAAPDPVATT